MSLYDVLGVAPDADPATLRRAYLDLARRYHPDSAEGDAELMLRINEAWAVLGDHESRSRYDMTLVPPAEAPRVRRLSAEGFVPLDDSDDPDEEWRYSEDVGDPRTAPARAVLFAPLLGVTLAVGVGILGLVTAQPAALRGAAILGVVSFVGFLVAPLVALAKASHFEHRR